MSLTYARADDLFPAREVMRDVWNGIYNSDFVIADCTSKNPNVSHESTPRGIKDFEEKLRAAIREVRQSPMFELRHRLYGNQKIDSET
jgi:hypothetical protein